MSHWFTNLLYHFVFSTKGGQPLITLEYQPRLYDLFLQFPNSKFEICLGSGSRSRTYIFGFKVRRAASCTIPEEVAQTSVCVVTNRGWSELIEYSMKRLAVTPQTEVCATRLCHLVAEEGIEPSSLDYRSSALALSYTAKRGLG